MTRKAISQKVSAFLRLLLLTLLFSASLAHADDGEPKRGVLSDGRAFRTDGEGNQLVDYIAELEVNVETLERRVYGLEDEVQEKQAAIDRLQRGEGSTAKVSERELIQPKAVEREVCPAQPVPVCPQRPSAVACPAAPRCDDRSGEVAALKSSLSESKTEAGQARAQLTQLRTQLEQERTARSQEVANYEDALQKLEGPAKGSAQQIAVISKNLEQTRLQAQNESDLRQKQERDFQNALRAKQQELEAKQYQLSAREAELGKLQSRIAELQDAQSKAQLRAEAPPVSPVGSVSYRASALPVTQPQQFSRASVSASAGTLAPSAPSSLLSSRERAVESLRGEVSSGLARLKMEIATRDSLFAHWDQRGRALQVKPSPLRTTRGSTPESISRDLSSFSSVRDLIVLRDEVRQLEGRVNDDIAIARRMSGKK